jgi:MYXO-CTERM domain-containing protein
MCGAASDCLSGVCESGACAAPSCTDAVQNGDEAEVDCGGACQPCETRTGGYAGGAVCAASTASGTPGAPLALVVLAALGLIVRSRTRRRR